MPFNESKSFTGKRHFICPYQLFLGPLHSLLVMLFMGVCLYVWCSRHDYHGGVFMRMVVGRLGMRSTESRQGKTVRTPSTLT